MYFCIRVFLFACIRVFVYWCKFVFAYLYSEEDKGPVFFLIWNLYLRIFTNSLPDFIGKHPALVTRSNLGRNIIAWDVAFSPYGLPKQWTPRFDDEGIRGSAGDVSVLTYNRRQLSTQSCHMVVNIDHGVPVISQVSLRTLRLLFGLH